MRNAIDRFFFGDVLAARVFLLRKAFLLLLGFDCVVELVPHGGRYGIGGFNVAHFELLDRLLPTPTPSLYVGLLLTTGLLSLTLALGRTARGGMLLLFALYTTSWAMSLLDSYQHHYLISLLLLSLAFFPDHEGREVFARGRAPATTSAIGYVSFTLTCAIVYAFTALTKLEPDWRSGAALARLVSPDRLPLLFWELEGRGLDEAGVFELLAVSAIGLQIACALAYALASTVDRMPTRGSRIGVALLGLFPAAFHLGVEQLDLAIGWFGTYMLVTALVCFLPRELLLPLGRAATSLPRSLGEALERAFPEADASNGDGRASPVSTDRSGGARSAASFASMLLAVATASAVVGIVGSFDLPGDLGAGMAFAASSLGLAFAETRRGHPHRARAIVLGTLAAAVLVHVAVTHGALRMGGDRPLLAIEASTVRYDYYRFVGGDRRRRGDVRAAIDAYRKAYRYAPDGESRDATASKLARLGAPPRE